MDSKVLDRLREQRGSIPLALLASIVAGGLIVVVIGATISEQRSVRFDRDFSEAVQVADGGINEAYFQLNNQLLLTQHSPRTVTGDVNGNPYTWTAVYDSDTREWTVTSVGQGSDDVDRTVVATITGRPRFHVAAFTDVNLGANGANNADSYDSSTGDWCTGNGLTGSNGTLMFPGGAQAGVCDVLLPDGSVCSRCTVDGVVLYDWDAAPDPGRCDHNTGTPNNCEADNAGTPRFDTIDEPLDLTSPNRVLFMQQALDACNGMNSSNNLSVWRTSVDGPNLGLPAANGVTLRSVLGQDWPAVPFRCVDRLIFDQDTNFSGLSSDSPAVFFVREFVCVGSSGGPGGGVGGGGGGGGSACGNGGQSVRVGCTGNACANPNPAAGQPRPDAGALQIYSLATNPPNNTNGGNVFQTIPQSVFTGGVYTPQGSCGGGASVHVYGSMICSEIRNVGAWQFHFDDNLASISSGEYVIARWREE